MANKNPIIPPVEARWKPGESGNPGGAPKGKKLSTVLRDLMDLTEAELLKFRQRKDLTVRERKALDWLDGIAVDKGGASYLDMALDRHEGKVVQTHKVIDAGRKGMTPEELDELWKRRQTRKS